MTIQKLSLLRVRDLIATIRRGRRQKRAMVHLYELDDNMLKDIGIGRCDIENVVRMGREGYRM